MESHYKLLSVEVSFTKQELSLRQWNSHLTFMLVASLYLIATLVSPPHLLGLHHGR